MGKKAFQIDPTKPRAFIICEGFDEAGCVRRPILTGGCGSEGHGRAGPDAR